MAIMNKYRITAIKFDDAFAGGSASGLIRAVDLP